MGQINEFPINTTNLSEVEERYQPDNLLAVENGSVTQVPAQVVIDQYLTQGVPVSDEISNVICASDDLVAVYQCTPADVVSVWLSSVSRPPINLTMSGTGTGTATNNTFTIWRYGNMVTIAVDCCMASTGQTTILTLPQEYRPPTSITSAVPSYTNASVMKYIVIGAGGSVSIYCSSTTERLLFSLSWAVA